MNITHKQPIMVAAALAAGLTIGGGTTALATNLQSDTNNTQIATSDDSSSTTEKCKGKPGGKRGAQHRHTNVTDDETTNVTNAVTAKESTITVKKVMKDGDGSYDVHGTKDGKRVMAEVSADFTTVDIREGAPRGKSRPGDRPPRPEHDSDTKQEEPSDS